MSVNKVAVQFKTFKIFGLVPITAPASAKGEAVRWSALQLCCGLRRAVDCVKVAAPCCCCLFLSQHHDQKDIF
jgi:hypothetical protein